jgi:uncharacterized protein YdaL
MARSTSTGWSVILKTLVVVATLGFFAAPHPADAASQARGKGHTTTVVSAATGEDVAYQMLPAPPAPPGAQLPQSRTLRTSTAQFSTTSAPLLNAAAPTALTLTQFAGAPGSAPSRNTLVLYDSTGAWAWLGEAYAVQAASLASHGSNYVMHPAASYVAGELGNYTGLIYVGSTYDEPLPTALLDDVLATSKPVLWMNDNIWQLAARATDAAFVAQYGWRPLYFDFSNALTVTYKGVALQRNPLAVPSGLLQTQIVDPAKAQAIATITSDTGVVSPWATRSGNFTYIGEVPFSYSGMNDRYLAAADLISQVSNPAMPARKRALVRIEDVSADTSPTQLRRIADYLYSKHVPFSVAVIPLYLDPNGVYNNGVAETRPLSKTTGVVNALKYMQARGGTIIMHGYTHQYSNVDNPYSGVSADDFEFYRSHISADNYVIYDAPPAEDSTSWAQGRVTAGLQEFAKAGFTPTIFEFPHYAGSALDYQVIQQQFGVRYDRGLYAAGWCLDGNCGTGTPDYTRIYGQFFPYLIRDIFGSVVIPENLGNVEPVEFNHNPPRSPQDILNSAKANTVITDGVQSFFFHPYLPLSNLKTIVQGIQAMGYQFVPADTIKQG